MKIKAVYDNKGKTIDRYSIVFKEKEGRFNIMLGLSSYPTHPQGFSIFGRCRDGNHLGTKIKFTDLPKEIQKHIIERIKD